MINYECALYWLRVANKHNNKLLKSRAMTALNKARKGIK